MIRVTAAQGLVTVQDRGRPGYMHLGIPRGGALVPSGLARANARLGNASGAAALEIFGRLALEALSPLALATDRGDLWELGPGERVELTSAPDRVVYLALPGGVDVPERLGSRATLTVAKFGGFEGRSLRRDDVVKACAVVGASMQSARDSSFPAPDLINRSFRLWPGTEPAKVSGEWTIAPASDRVGVRLAGPAVKLPPLGGSVPMVQGAVQVPPDGQPIVLGPDHPTTGGYPVLGFLDDADFDRFYALPIGSRVRLLC